MLYNKAIVRKSAYVVFSVIATLLIVLISTQMKASAAAPGVVFTSASSNTAGSIDITATATTSGSDTLSFLSSINGNTRHQYWNWGTVSDAADCDANGFSDEGDANRSGTNDAVTFTVTKPTTDTHFCVKVLYSSSGSQSFRAYYAYYFHDVTAPEIEVSQSGLTLNALSNDPSGIKTWEVWSGSTQPSACDNSLTYLTTTSTGKNKHSETLTANDNDKWYCFHAVDNQDNDGYSDSVQIDTTSPTLSASQSEDSATVELSVSQDDDGDNSPDDNTDIDIDSWQYVQTSRNCESTSSWRDLSQLTDILDQDGAEIVFGRSQVNRAYCFRVADEAGNYAYASHTIGSINEPPVINRLSQNKQSVIATATDRQYLADSSWQYTLNDDQACDSSLSNWRSVGSNGFSSNDQQNQVTLDISEVVINESTDNQWLCFRVADNISSNYGYRSLDVDAEAPDVSLVQNNKVLKASAPTADKAISSSWRYVSHTSRFDCDAEAFELYTPIKSGSTINLVDSQKGDYFCFRVADRHDNYGYTSYRVRSLDTVAPKITASQNNNLLTVAPVDGTTVDKDTWGYYKAGNSEPDCEEIGGSNYDDIDDLTIELDENDIGDWFCVRAADDYDNYGYYKIRLRALDNTAPQISITRDENILEASTTAEDVDTTTWQYIAVERGDRYDCEADNDELEFNSASARNDRVLLSVADNNKYYCFRVADKAGNYGYAISSQIYNVEPVPVITITQHTADKRLQVSTNDEDVDGLTWGWVVVDTNPDDCSQETYTSINNPSTTAETNRIAVNNIGDSQNGKYYCFRVANVDGNYGYSKHVYDLTAPTIRFELTNNILVAISDDSDVDISTWHYSIFRENVNCQTAAIDEPLSYRKLSLKEEHNGFYVCVRVSDRVGNTAYARYLIGSIDESDIPTVDVTQTKNVIIATSADTDIDPLTWRYALTTNEPYCGLGHSLTLTKNNVGALNRVDLVEVGSNYNWVCFQVSDQTGNKGFAKVEIDRQAPTIQIQQNAAFLIAQSDADDLNADSWGYAVSVQDSNCNSETVFEKVDFNSSQISFNLTDADSGKYFCFKVADKIGNTAYVKTQVDTIDLEAPAVSFSQNGNILIVSANDVDASSWQYARSRDSLNCSEAGNLNFNQASTSNARLTLSAADSGYWYCFQVTGNNGVVGYTKVLVDNIDTRAPEVEVSQQEDVVIATADENNIAEWNYVTLPSEDSECDASTFTGTNAVQSGNQLTVDADDEGLTYCFRATDANNNTGYEVIEVKVGAEDTDDDSGNSDDTVIRPSDNDSSNDQTDADQDESDEDGGIGGTITVLIIIGSISVLTIIVVLIRSSQRSQR